MQLRPFTGVRLGGQPLYRWLTLHGAATQANILAALDCLGAGAAAGDSLVFGFSGHGAPGSAEGGGPALLPCDFRTVCLAMAKSLPGVWQCPVLRRGLHRKDATAKQPSRQVLSGVLGVSPQ